MNVQSIIHRPEVVVPDATIDNVTPQQLTDAVNVRITKFTAEPGRNVGVRTITGNVLVPNQYLPDGENFTVGSCTDNVNAKIFFANWNSEGNHGIYVIDTNTESGNEIVAPVVRWSGLNFGKDDYVSMAYNRNTIIWCCPGAEPRYVDVEKAINTEIFFETGVAPGPILDLGQVPVYSQYVFNQLKKGPLEPPNVRYLSSGFVQDYGVTASQTILFKISQDQTQHPLPYVTKNGYQFAYNYIYKDNTESALSPASKVFFGITQNSVPTSYGSVYHAIFADGFEKTYIQLFGQVKKIKWYVRTGNVGEWIWFDETTIVDGQTNISIPDYAGLNSYTFNTYGIQKYKIDNLTSIGVINPAAELAVNGIAPRVVENLFADNRIIHAGLIFGAEFKPAKATLSIEILDLWYKYTIQAESRVFAPIKRKKKFILVFFDSSGRQLGTRQIGEIDTPINPTAFVERSSGQASIQSAFGSANSELDWAKKAIAITPNSTQQEYESMVDAGINVIKLGVQDEFEVPFFIRQQVRTIWVYQDEAGQFFYGSPNIIGMASSGTWSGVLSFYGIGFMMSKTAPVNFSLEQKYYISVRATTGNGTTPTDKVKTFYEKQFEITAVDKNVLISKQDLYQQGERIVSYVGVGIAATLRPKITNTGNDDTWLEDLWEEVAGSDDEIIYSDWRFDYTDYGSWSQSIADIVLYSKNDNSNEYKIIPGIRWYLTEFDPTSPWPYPAYYYGDSYRIVNTSVVDAPSISDWYVYTQGAPNGQGGFTGGGLQKIVNYSIGYNSQTFIRALDSKLTVASMSLSGVVDVEYAKDLDNVIAQNENPRQQKLLRTYAHGEQYIEGTEINSWFLFNPNNRRTVSGNIGSIVRVINQSLTTNQGENIYLYCTQGVEMVFLGKVQQLGTDGTGVLSLSTNIFGTTNVMKLPYGPKKPQHLTQTTAGLTYYFDSSNKVLVQVSASGQDSISEQRKFQTDTQKITDSAIMGFDPYYMEVIVNDNNNGLAYNIIEEKYQGRRVFPTNDLLTFISSNNQSKTMYGFYNGQIYKFLHYPTSIININDAPIVQIIKFVSNHEIHKHKVFSFIKLMAEYNNGVDQIDWTAFIEGYNQGQLGVNPPLGITIQPSEFVKRNYYYQATIKTAEQIDSFDGPLITGPFIEVTLIGDEKYKNLIFAEIGYTLPPAQ